MEILHLRFPIKHFSIQRKKLDEYTHVVTFLLERNKTFSPQSTTLITAKPIG